MTDEIIKEKMDGNIVGGTIVEAIEQYRKLPHQDYSFDGGCICICDLPEFHFIAFAWCESTFKARKNFVAKTREIYDKSEKPFLFTGKKNYFAQHSIEISENIWQYVPKMI